jgi:hypothetical protein
MIRDRRLTGLERKAREPKRAYQYNFDWGITHEKSPLRNFKEDRLD